jgi:hypothetical protein
MDFNEIAPNLFLGEKPRTLEDFVQMTEYDVVFEFNKAEDFSQKNLDHLLGSHAQIGALKQRIDAVQWYQVPLNDELPTGAVKNYNKVVRPFMECRLTGQKIYVHCKNGLHRSSHFLIYVEMLGGADYDEAFAVISKKRKIQEKPLLKQQLEEWYNDRR